MSELLANIFSRSDAYKRRLVDALRNPRAALEQRVGQMNDDARGFNEMTYEAAAEPRLTGPQGQALAMKLAESYNPVGMTKVTGPRAEALETARKNAVKMLGLPENNTPMDRAKALGFNKEGVHFSRHGGEFAELDSGKYAMAPFDAVGTHIGSKDAAMDRFRNTVATTDQMKGTSYPVLIRANKPYMTKDGAAWSEDDLMLHLRKIGGYDEARRTYPELNKELRDKVFGTHTNIPYVNDVEAKGQISQIVPPQNIRSRFAAFDPARINENDLLGRADPKLLTALAGGTAATVAALRSRKDDDRKKKDKDE